VDTELFADERLNRQGDAEPGDSAVQGVREGRAQTRNHARFPALLKRPPNAEQVDRAHRRCNDQAGGQPADWQFQVHRYGIRFRYRSESMQQSKGNIPSTDLTMPRGGALCPTFGLQV
jgi:hypothetical protein